MSKVSSRWSRLLGPVVAVLMVAPIASTAAAGAAADDPGAAVPSTSVPGDDDRTPADQTSETDPPPAIVPSVAVSLPAAGAEWAGSAPQDDTAEHDAGTRSAADTMSAADAMPTTDSMSTGATSATAATLFEVTDTSIRFPDVYLNDATSRSITITNISDTPLIVSTVGGDSPGSAFHRTGGCSGAAARLDPGASCHITYRFEPRGARYFVVTFDLVVSVFDVGSGDLLDQATFPVELGGVGLFPFTLNPRTLRFPATELDEFSFAVVDITNASSFGQGLKVTAGAPTAPPFRLEDGEGAYGDVGTLCEDVLDELLEANETCVVVYGFYPESPGFVTDSAQIIVASLDHEDDEPLATNAYTIDLEGTGGFLPFPLTVSPTVEFPDQPVGADAAVRFATIGNISDMRVEFDYRGAVPSHPSFTFDRSDQSTCDAGTSLDPGESCVLAYQFLPPAAGTFTDRVEIVITATDDLDVTLRATFAVELAGTGVDASVPTTTVDDPDDPDDPDGPDGADPDDGDPDAPGTGDPDAPGTGDPDEPGVAPTSVVAGEPTTPAGQIAGELPRTGGAPGWILAAALLALLGGAQLLFAARPRGDDVRGRSSRS